MDEPLSNLDAKLRVQTRAELIKLHERLQATFVYVTHDQVEAMTMGTRIAVMNKGLLQQVDTPQNLYDSPANMFVAGFIGSPAMNFFEAKLAGSDEALAVETKAFRLDVPAKWNAVLKPYLGNEVMLGIRPEDIYVRSDLPAGISGTEVRGPAGVSGDDGQRDSPAPGGQRGCLRGPGLAAGAGSGRRGGGPAGRHGEDPPVRPQDAGGLAQQGDTRCRQVMSKG